MTRLLRWTFLTLAAASLVLCLATAGLWVRSYWVYDQLYAYRLHAPDRSVRSTSVGPFALFVVNFGTGGGSATVVEGTPTKLAA